MADEDQDPWGTGDTEEEVPAAEAATSAKATPKAEGTPAKVATPVASTPAKVATPAKEATPAAASKAPSPGLVTPRVLPEGEVPAQDDIHIRRPLVLYKHWVRPQFLQYKYMYDYRTNYYNDVIDYLDKRSRGVKVEVPRAQYWAERVLRTHTNLKGRGPAKEKKEESHLIQTIAATIRTHNYHSTAYINRKYARVL